MMWYLSTTNIASGSAQSIQIMQMAKHFFEVHQNFSLCLPTQPQAAYPDWIVQLPISITAPRSVRTIQYIRALRHRIQPGDRVFTREIMLAWWAAKQGANVIYEVHKPFETVLGKFLARRTFGKPQVKIVAISQALQTHIETTYPLAKGTCYTFHDGYDTTGFGDRSMLDKSLYKLPSDQPILMYTGSLQPGKGAEILVEVAQKMEGIQVVIVGGKKGDILSHPQITHIPRVPHEHIPLLLTQAQMLILPMNDDLSYAAYASPLKLFEYLASGVPVLVSDCGTVREVVDEKDVFFFQPKEVMSLLTKITTIIDSYDDAIQKANHAQETVKQYAWKERVNNILELYDTNIT